MDDYGEHEFEIITRPALYPEVVITNPVTAVISGCLLSLFEPTQPFQDIDYAVGYPAVTE